MLPSASLKPSTRTVYVPLSGSVVVCDPSGVPTAPELESTEPSGFKICTMLVGIVASCR